MLIEFSVGNYRSFFAPVTLSLQAAKLRAGKSNRALDEDNVFAAQGMNLLRSAVIYGANASGKSNLIHAMHFMRRFVLQSSKESQVGEAIQVERFRLSTAAGAAPAYFQIVLCLDGKRYRYGFEVDNHRVCAEWLYHTAQRETRLFVRDGSEYDVSGVFKEGQGLQERTRDNALYLSVVAQFNGPLATALLRWFRTRLNVISGLDDVAYSGFTMRQFETDERFRQRVLTFLREADVGIADISIEKKPLVDTSMPDRVRAFVEQLVKQVEGQTEAGLGNGEAGLLVQTIKTAHKVFDQNRNPAGLETFTMEDQESQGTRKLFNLSGPLLDTLDAGKVLVVDEMEARLHPNLMRMIVELFNSSRTNPKNAQLIFATHDAGLLSQHLFRRDQVWFTEKDKYGATALYSLAELKERNDASFGKDYVAGKYGAVPFIGGLRSLFEENDYAQTPETERA